MPPDPNDSQNAPTHQRDAIVEIEPAFSDRVVRFLRKASVIGLALSLAIHLTLWIILSLISINRDAPARLAQMDEGVEFAVMTEQDLATLMEAALATTEPTVPEVPIPDAPAHELLDAPMPDDLIGLPDQLEDLDAVLGGGDIGDGAALGDGGSGSGGASFFGVEAQGRRFAFIVDVSGSMAYGGKIDALRSELNRSISDMIDNTEFFIILYSGNAWPMGGKAEWIDANDRGKRWARRLIVKITPSGSTNPSPGFFEAFAIRPRPDAIYFMTDGEFSSDLLIDLTALNGEVGIPIHCISFVSRQSEALMREIARISDGSYTYIPGPRP